MKDLYNENYKMLNKELKRYKEEYPCSQIGSTSLKRTSQSHLQIKELLIKNQNQ